MVVLGEISILQVRKLRHPQKPKIQSNHESAQFPLLCRQVNQPRILEVLSNLAACFKLPPNPPPHPPLPTASPSCKHRDKNGKRISPEIAIDIQTDNYLEQLNAQFYNMKPRLSGISTNPAPPLSFSIYIHALLLPASSWLICCFRAIRIPSLESSNPVCHADCCSQHPAQCDAY